MILLRICLVIKENLLSNKQIVINNFFNFLKCCALYPCTVVNCCVNGVIILLYVSCKNLKITKESNTKHKWLSFNVSIPDSTHTDATDVTYLSNVKLENFQILHFFASRASLFCFILTIHKIADTETGTRNGSVALWQRKAMAATPYFSGGGVSWRKSKSA